VLAFAPKSNGNGKGDSGAVGQCISACAHKWKPCTQNEPMCGDCKETCKDAYQPSRGFGVSKIHSATLLLSSLTTLNRRFLDFPALLSVLTLFLERYKS
jgi:hypothetical protein